MDASPIDDAQNRATTMTWEATGSGGPVAPTRQARLRLWPLNSGAAKLDAAGFLGGWQVLNRSATIDHCIGRLEAAGNLANFRRLRDPSAEPFHGFWFADSDVYKVLEAIGWETGRAGDAGWSGFVDEAVAAVRGGEGGGG